MVDDVRARKPLLPPRAHFAGGGGGGDKGRRMLRKWALKLGTSILLWTVIMQLTSLLHPRIPKSWPSGCVDCHGRPNATNSVLDLGRSPPSPPTIIPQSVQKKFFKKKCYLMLVLENFLKLRKHTILVVTLFIICCCVHLDEDQKMIGIIMATKGWTLLVLFLEACSEWVVFAEPGNFLSPTLSFIFLD